MPSARNANAALSKPEQSDAKRSGRLHGRSPPFLLRITEEKDAPKAGPSINHSGNHSGPAKKTNCWRASGQQATAARNGKVLTSNMLGQLIIYSEARQRKAYHRLFLSTRSFTE